MIALETIDMLCCRAANLLFPNRGMQTCFKQYPEIYGSELTDEGDDADLDAPADAPPANEAAPIQARQAESAVEAPATPAKQQKAEAETSEKVEPKPKVEAKVEAPATTETEEKKETPTAPPKVIEPPAPAWEDARSANDKQ